MIGVRPFGANGVVTLVSVAQLERFTKNVSPNIEGIDETEIPEDLSTWDSLNSQDNLEDQENLEEQHSSHPLLKELPAQDVDRLKRAAVILRQRLIFRVWLDDHGLLEYAPKFNNLGVSTIEDAYWFEDVKILEDTIGGKIVPMWTMARQSLPEHFATLDKLRGQIWQRLLRMARKDGWIGWSSWGTVLLVTLSIAGFSILVKYCPMVMELKKALLSYVYKSFSLASNAKVQFDWDEPIRVGKTVSFSIFLYHRGGSPYPVCDEDNILIEVKRDTEKIAIVTEFGGKEPHEANMVVVKFSVRKAGTYSIHILLDNNHVRGSPFRKTFLPGKIDASKTVFLKHTSTVVCVTGLEHKLYLEPRDVFGNVCRSADYNPMYFGFCTEDIEDTHQRLTRKSSVHFSPDTTTPLGNRLLNISSLSPKLSVYSDASSESGRVTMKMRFPEPDVFRGAVTYDNKKVQNGDFEIIVLNSTEANAVQTNVQAKTSQTQYEGKLIAIGREVQTKSRKIFVRVSSKQLVVREYVLGLFPLKVATFRLSPNTKLQFLGQHNELRVPVILIDDGCQPAIKVAIKDAKIVVATFNHFLLRNIGGSETFQDKQEHFFKELREVYRKTTRDKLTLKIARDNIIETSFKQVKGLSTTDWCRNFEISFVGEQGIDWGGLRREWFEQICGRMFESGNPVGMFRSFGESRLVHPNFNSRWKPKYFEMAGKIVGKCMYESSLGSAYRQMVKARFTRSFLAQLIGLRVTYRHFEQDDPELYLGKIKFILENDVDCMDLNFTEEEYDPMGKLVKTVDLVPDGSKLRVTNENKQEYLNALAQYKLVAKVKTEVEAFLKGLNDIVPDELLSIFDENELELLMCGTSEYSVTELREHHTISGANEEFRKVLEWFWTAVANMTEEEKARLLQFTTGSSLLPPGGFRELSPLFQLTPSPTYGILPTAHTCFNQLCLPDYDSYESFEKSLRIAIYEGSEGFGLI